MPTAAPPAPVTPGPAAAYGNPATEDAIARADRNGNDAWKKAARRAIERLARATPGFTTDDVWALLAETDAATHDPRALGPVIQKAARDGVISNSGTTRRSERRHAAPITVWVAADHAAQPPAPAAVPDGDSAPEAVDDLPDGVMRIVLLPKEGMLTSMDPLDAANRLGFEALRIAYELLGLPAPEPCSSCGRPARWDVEVGADNSAATRHVYRCPEHRTVAPKKGETIVGRSRLNEED